VSVLTRKHPVSGASGRRGQVINAARQVGPLAGKTMPLAQQAAIQAQQVAQQAAQQAAPLARNAGDSIRQGADGAMSWAVPKVDAARHWAAPQLEQSAHAISENLAPMISSALITAAHKIDVKPKKSAGRRRGMLIGAMLVTVAGGAAAVLATRRWQSANGYSAAGDSASLGPVSDDQMDAEGGYSADGDAPDPDANGHPRIV
jgi:hypothetical protein